MEEIVLEAKDAVDWSYRGEGDVNLVLAYTGSSPTYLGKVMRIAKKLKNGNENGDTSGNDLTSLEILIWGDIKDLASCQNKEMVDYLFVKHVMRPLLGHKHVNAGIRRLVATEFLESVEKMVTSQPLSRRANPSSVDTNRTSELLMDDLTRFTHGHVEDGKPCLTVEIKPKYGFLPSSSFIAEENVIKKSVTRFKMQQVLKLRQNENGSLVFGGFRGSKCITTSKVELAFKHILKGIFKTEDDDVCASSFIELVAETIYASGALDQLLHVQKLDKYNIEGVIHAYYDLIDQPCKACQELEKSKLSNQVGAVHSKPHNEKVNILKNFLISSTATDCSVMVSIRSRETGLSSSSSHGNVHLESTKQDFEYKVHFIDLDMRSLNRIEANYESDKMIMKSYLEMLKTKGDKP